MDRLINKFVSIMTIDIFFLIGVLLLTLWLMTIKPANYPPGPPKWPIVGNLFQMRVKGQIHRGMGKLSEKYGEVVGMFVGNAPVVLISGLDAIHEAAKRDDLSARPENLFQKLLNKGNSYGFVSINGEVWKEQRRFTLHHLRDLGFGKRKLEGIAHEEIEALFRDIDRLSGGIDDDFRKPVCFHDILGGALINVLWHVMSGQRYDHNDPQFKKILAFVRNYLSSVTPDGGIIHAFPIIAKLIPSLTNMKDMQVARDAMHDFIEVEISMHRKTIDFEHPRDFIDIYLSEIEKQKADADTSFNEMQLKQICMDLFLGGTDTTHNSILFALLYMILYPDVQKKIHEELDKIVGKDRLPSLEDRAKLPYLDAFIKEAQRLGMVAPVGLSHAPFTENNEISFRGYKIPKHSRVLLNLYDVHHNQKYWDEPYQFKPERFLDTSGEVIHHEAFMPFGSGKRSCLGEALARNHLYLFIAAIMQRYSLSVPYGCPRPSADPAGSFVLSPKLFEAKVQLRK